MCDYVIPYSLADTADTTHISLHICPTRTSDVRSPGHAHTLVSRLGNAVQTTHNQPLTTMVQSK